MISPKSYLSNILVEIRTSLPGKHELTLLGTPEDPLDPGYDSIGTGDSKSKQLSNNFDFVIGSIFWVGWFGYGVYSWWFVDANIVDLVIVTIGWLTIFVFTLAGVPLFRLFGRNRDKS
jgi:hypothetical protein